MPLYDSSMEKDNCGFGLIAHLKGIPSHKLVRTAISSLARMSHRGAVSADGKTGDGCGVLLQKPDAFFRHIARENKWHLADHYGVGIIFFGHDPAKQQAAEETIGKELEKQSLTIAGWREVPVNPGVLGEIAAKNRPDIRQVLINAPFGWRARDLERRLYIARRRIEKKITADPDFYICSFSNMVVVYKGLCRPADLPLFLPGSGEPAAGISHLSLSPALLHQHPAPLAPGTAVPVSCPQRGTQHHCRKPAVGQGQGL